MFHEGTHRATGRTLAALEAAAHRTAGEVFHLVDEIEIHRPRGEGHFGIFQGRNPLKRQPGYKSDPLFVIILAIINIAPEKMGKF